MQKHKKIRKSKIRKSTLFELKTKKSIYKIQNKISFNHPEQYRNIAFKHTFINKKIVSLKMCPT